MQLTKCGIGRRTRQRHCECSAQRAKSCSARCSLRTRTRAGPGGWVVSPGGVVAVRAWDPVDLRVFKIDAATGEVCTCVGFVRYTPRPRAFVLCCDTVAGGVSTGGVGVQGGQGRVWRVGVKRQHAGRGAHAIGNYTLRRRKRDCHGVGRDERPGGRPERLQARRIEAGSAAGGSSDRALQCAGAGTRSTRTGGRTRK